MLAHFSSPERATDVLAAASLDRRTAMRPYDALSGGEQERGEIGEQNRSTCLLMPNIGPAPISNFC